MEYTAIVKRSGEWWIGWIEEVPGVNCQERTHEKLRKSLAETLSEALEFNRREARAAAGDNYREEKLPWHEADPVAEASSGEWVQSSRDLGVEPGG